MDSSETARRGPGPAMFIAIAVVLMALLAVVGAILYSARREVKDDELGARCADRARAIATAVVTYRQAHGQWPSDPDYYVKLFGYRLRSETGYYGEKPPWFGKGAPAATQSRAWAAGVEVFTCPLDGAPVVNAHGIPSSYQVVASPQWMDAEGKPIDPSKVLVVTENERLHPLGVRFAGHRAYADLHVELGERQE